jgi:MOSC domain-containing protein YiiM
MLCGAMLARIEAICVAPAAEAGMVALTQVEAIANVGLRGDRYAEGIGFYSPRPTDPGAREVTLIEAEALDALRVQHGIELAVTEHRRNLTTRGIRLRELIGQQFRIGDVLLQGVKDCPPCEHLQGLVNKPVLQPLVNTGGIRARVLKGGTLRVGDELDVLRTLHQQPIAR